MPLGHNSGNDAGAVGLVERLRRKPAGGPFKHMLVNPDGPTAADEIERLQAIIARLTNPAEPSEAWQPIETAPRDGTRFLATEDGRDHYALAWNSDGYWESYCGQHVTQTPEPTHWQPLPKPPLAMTKGGGQ